MNIWGGWIGSAMPAPHSLALKLRAACFRLLIVEPDQLCWYDIKPKTHDRQNKKRTRTVHFLFWWEWVDSNHLSRKTTDLQSAPALQLRRTPKTQFLVRAAGIEPAFQAWKACILALELCSPLFYRRCDYILFFYKRKYLF